MGIASGSIKERRRARRRLSIRKRLSGTAERPRVSVYRSLKHIHCQVIDDDAARTLVAASSMDSDLRAQGVDGGTVEGAKAVGALIAKRCLEKDIKKVVLDRGGFLYHGRVKALADAAREGGLEF